MRLRTLVASGIRPPWLGGLVCSLVVGVTGCGPADPSDPADPAAPTEVDSTTRKLPNILLLSIDTLRRDALRVYSEEALPLPHLDRFAEQSAVFLQAHSTASWTLPAQASLLSGLYPDRHGATTPLRRMRRDSPTLAGGLRRLGLHTVGLTDGGFLHQTFGLARGFDRYDRQANTREYRKLQRKLPRQGARAAVTGSALFDRAMAFLETRQDQEQPFFLFLQTYSVHDYFLVHPWAAEQVGAEGLADKEHYHKCTLGEEPGTAEDWQHMVELYQAELQHLDQGFGRLLDALEEHGLADNTLIVLVSDHGEGFDADRGRIHHAGRLHEDLIRMPFLIQGPGIEPRHLEAPVSLVDVLPTLLDLAGSELPEGLDGVSLAPLLRDGVAPEERVLFAMEHHQYWEDGARHTQHPPSDAALSVAVLRGPWWYILDRAGGEQLYQMEQDPAQVQALPVEDQAGKGLRALAAERATRRVEGEVRELDPEAEAQLRALGYID